MQGTALAGFGEAYHDRDAEAIYEISLLMSVNVTKRTGRTLVVLKGAHSRPSLAVWSAGVSIMTSQHKRSPLNSLRVDIEGLLNVDNGAVSELLGDDGSVLR